MADPVDPNVDPTADNRPSEIVSGFYDDTPVNEILAEETQLVPIPTETPPIGEWQTSATDVPNNLNYQYPTSPGGGTPYDDDGNINPGWSLDEDNNPVYVGTNFIEPATAASAEASRIAAGTKLAQQQAAIAAQRGQQQSKDWRVRLQLAPGANYLYKSPQPGILQPLVPTDGIIFPYTPKIDMSYRANYTNYELTHSNYKGYFYQGSEVSDINLTCTFTAQDTAQANYVLAVIHFFRSATKMFYGQDAQRGSPPPLVFLSGLGQYQFNEHACLISEFTYNLPNDVDYIRAQTTNQAGLNLTAVNNYKQGVTTNAVFASLSRLANAFTTKGALNVTPYGSTSVPNLATGSPTYVPTKMEISIKLLPVVSRQKVSQQFSVKNFATGNGLKGGFW